MGAPPPPPPLCPGVMQVGGCLLPSPIVRTANHFQSPGVGRGGGGGGGRGHKRKKAKNSLEYNTVPIISNET